MNNAIDVILVSLNQFHKLPLTWNMYLSIQTIIIKITFNPLTTNVSHHIDGEHCSLMG